MNPIIKPGIRLGVTGGIGSGKTSVCKVFSVLGIPVFSADNEAQKIMSTDPDIIKNINRIAGKNMFHDGTLDRGALASLIFSDSDALTKVNSLVHPIVSEHFKAWVENQNSPYVIMEAAILFESGASSLVDRIVTVVAPVEERIERVMHGSRLSREQVMQRIENQFDDETRISKSDYIIYNAENDMIIPEILRIDGEIRNHLKS